jgi:hypothetical protein
VDDGTTGIVERTFGNMTPPSERDLVAGVAPRLRELLPSGWTVELESAPAAAGDGPADAGWDGLLSIASPDGRVARLVVQAKSLLSPRDAAAIAARTGDGAGGAQGTLAVARYLSPSAREALTKRGLSYIDVTGNVRLALDDPGLAVLAPGADRDPFRSRDRPTNSLKGLPAAKVARALVDRPAPWRMRELAAEAGASLGSTARTVDFLDREALVVRERGTVIEVDWPQLLRRWTADYDVSRGRRITPALAARGLDALEAGLRDSATEYVISGSLAARRLAPYADARLGLVYAGDADALTRELGIRPVPSRANVLIVEPADELPYMRARSDEGLRFAAPSQVFADLMSGPGRNPEEAAELLAWMERNEGAWRR